VLDHFVYQLHVLVAQLLMSFRRFFVSDTCFGLLILLIASVRACRWPRAFFRILWMTRLLFAAFSELARDLMIVLSLRVQPQVGCLNRLPTALTGSVPGLHCQSFGSAPTLATR
jgi:hypothetical protein